MADSTTKKLLDSALTALLKGLELSPWVKVPATFVAELSKRFQNLPDEEKTALIEASDGDVQSALPNEITDQPDELLTAVQQAAFRGRVLDYLFGVSNSRLDEIITRVEGARDEVSTKGSKKQKVAELVEFAESSDGPGLEGIPVSF